MFGVFLPNISYARQPVSHPDAALVRAAARDLDEPRLAAVADMLDALHALALGWDDVYTISALHASSRKVWVMGAPSLLGQRAVGLLDRLARHLPPGDPMHPGVRAMAQRHRLQILEVSHPDIFSPRGPVRRADADANGEG